MLLAVFPALLLAMFPNLCALEFATDLGGDGAAPV